MSQREEQLDAMIEALQEITKAAGPFNRDPLIHARNCIQDMQATAVNVLKRYGITPCRGTID